jgi:hypothetical protein
MTPVLKKHKPFLIHSLLFVMFLSPLHAQMDTTFSGRAISNKKLKILAATETTFYVASYSAFYQLWYKDFDKSSFHFFNDGREWLGIDKLGHSCGTYWLSNLNSKAFLWSGLNHHKSILYGTLSSFLFMSTIEIFDGLSKEWGASPWDLAADAGGATLFLVQELAFKKQLVTLKYAYCPSNYSKYRPEVLGGNLAEKMLKDYNATTFWLSVNLNTLGNRSLPAWFNLALGYGATGMTGGFENFSSPEPKYKLVPNSERASEFYISTDIDLSKIKVKSKFLKGLLYTLNFIKIPGPTLGYSKKGWKLNIR